MHHQLYQPWGKKIFLNIFRISARQHLSPASYMSFNTSKVCQYFDTSLLREIDNDNDFVNTWKCEVIVMFCRWHPLNVYIFERTPFRFIYIYSRCKIIQDLKGDCYQAQAHICLQLLNLRFKEAWFDAGGILGRRDTVDVHNFLLRVLMNIDLK